MRILVTETRVYVVEVDPSYAQRRSKDLGCSLIDACKWIAQARVKLLPRQDFNEPGFDKRGTRLIHTHGVSNEARGMAPGEEV